MPTKPTTKQWKDLNAELIPQVAEWLDRHDSALTDKGRKFALRATQKANLAGGAGTRTLFEPVLLVATATEPTDVDDLFAVCDRIPFTGDYFQWDYVRATYAAAYRIFTRRGDPERAQHPLQMLSFPENGEQLADPFASGLQAIVNRANGSVLGRSADYPRPATTTPALQHLLGAVREWNIMWSYGISPDWTRDKIDTELVQALAAASSFVHTA
ncbi:hypothetical protein V1Y59_15250 [Gordonia sp. PKS22-38]|uniref:Uncharacterized protein n=1 Tax=Gordonia prachuapensis TaxID=3115651 RepID=A0ABU7MVS3_9ACTN|nr:hypothetical protein [Gordonia sp. PKS22-38]